MNLTTLSSGFRARLHLASTFVLWAFAALSAADEVDVFLLSGQSNMQGSGRVKNLPDAWKGPIENSFYWNGKDFEQLNALTTSLAGGKPTFGPELGFVRGLKRGGFKKPIYIIKFFRSGQPLHHGWNRNKWEGGEPAPGRFNFYPGRDAGDENVGKHYADWIRQAKAGLKKLADQGHNPVVRGVGWMQGEQDSKHRQSTAEYASSLSHLRKRLAEDLNSGTVPWVFGQVLPHEPAMARFVHRKEIRENMAAIDERSGDKIAEKGIRMVSTDQFDLLKDTVHYDAAGQRKLGLAFAREMLVLCREVSPLDIRKSIQKAKIGFTEKIFHGFESLEFDVSGIGCKIVRPKTPAKGQPWIWRARFWGHEPQLDVALLKKGWHVCYCDVSNLFGSDKAIRRWDKFYALTQKVGLHPQPVLEGMSRGGLICLRWANSNPDQVSGIYLDNAVMDFNSWPGGKGASDGSQKAWLDCLKAYGLDEQQAEKYTQGPLARLTSLAQMDVPIFVLVNEADKVVPPAENADLLIERYKSFGGAIEVMRRPGLGHHPHSLKDPLPLVDFAVGAVQKTGT